MKVAYYKPQVDLKPFLILGLLIIATTDRCLAEEQSHASSTWITFNHDEIERKYLLYVPKNLPSNAPLVFMLHGYRGDARDYMGELGMNAIADKHHFAICYPQGEDDREGIPHWNARLKISEVDDIGFLTNLAFHLQKQHRFSPTNTYTCGVSNGGFMSYTLIAEKPEVFRAAASVIGTMSGYTWRHRQLIRPVPILQISGLDDEVVPYDGTMASDGGWGGAPNQSSIIEFLTTLNKTKSNQTIHVSNQTTAHIYHDGVHGNEIWHYKIKNFGHRIPGNRELGCSVGSLIWKFFARDMDSLEGTPNLDETKKR